MHACDVSERAAIWVAEHEGLPFGAVLGRGAAELRGCVQAWVHSEWRWRGNDLPLRREWQVDRGDAGLRGRREEDVCGRLAGAALVIHG